jgi:hypothetical protein
MPGMGIAKGAAKAQLVSSMRRDEGIDVEPVAVPKKKKGTRRKVQFKLSSSMTDMTRLAGIHTDQALDRYESGEEEGIESGEEEYVSDENFEKALESGGI